ncbi:MULTISPECIES: hypothetical protein [unclassified Flavobacterium]|uniref:hypothetical protein n=1 Tax=unclassified Flavobacterium TaxID=196869 RepID=UPI001F13D617|nr:MULTISPECIES: hypothetical protein [unclassified Flavobacterium]UMY65660.1 hypothetical protein MKO97_14315 [Flavobacterium sp. HJ-32-4]
MSNIDKLHDLTLNIKEIIHELQLPRNDVRKAYFENLYSIVSEFYHGKIFFRISEEIKNRRIKFDSTIIELKPHIDRIYEIADHNLLANSYHNELNRKLFVDSFTNFETTLSHCFEEIVSQESLDEIVKAINFTILKICGNLSEFEKSNLLNELHKTTFIPLSRKFKFLSKLQTECYPFDRKADLKFIEFCSKLRNCVSHSAGYYKGRDYEYEFEGVKFIFKDDKFLEMKGENNYIFLKINEKLTNIVYGLLRCLKDVRFIKYPDDGF